VNYRFDALAVNDARRSAEARRLHRIFHTNGAARTSASSVEPYAAPTVRGLSALL